jgi:MFS family permease
VYQLDVAGLRAAAANPARTRFWARISRTVWLLGLVSFFTDVSSEMVASVLPAYLLLQMHVTPLEFGLVDGLYQGVTALARLASGLTADRWRRYKVVATIGYGVSAVCKLGLAAVGGGWAWVASVISADRVGKGIRTAPRDALISLSAREGDLAATFGVHRALDTAGVIVGPLIAFAILSTVPGDFSAIFVVSFAVAVVGVAMIGLLVEDVEDVKDARGAAARLPSDPPPASLQTVAALLKDSRFVAMTVMGALLGVPVMSDAFLYLMLQKASGISAGSLPLMYIGTSAAYLLLAVPAGRAADRIGRGRVFLAGHATILALYAALAFVELNPALVVICLVLHGIYYAATDGVVAALVSGAVPAEHRATGLAITATATSTARLVGSVAIGAAWNWYGRPTAVAFSLVGTAICMLWATKQLSLIERTGDAR